MIYKMCSIRRGKFVSLFYREPPISYSILEYNIGEVTRAETEWGVFCYPNLASVQSQLDILREPHSIDNFKVALFRVESTGEEILARFSSGCRNFRAIKLTRMLWRDTNKRKRRRVS